jgi:tryptophan synthase alpha chain
MSTRIADAFARAAADRRAALVAYLTAYDGGADHSLACLRAVADAGADVIELGIPFSDPSADGAAIQAAMLRALQGGATLRGVLDLVAELRAKTEVPVVLFGYANPVVQFGAGSFAAAAVRSGADGVLLVDLPPEHAGFVREPVRAAGLDWIGLVAPTTTILRREAVCAAASGFVYAITLRGVTGAALGGDDQELREQIAAARVVTKLPIAAGFGVRTAAQAKRLASVADGVVVGSALVEAAMAGADVLGARVAELREAVRG